MSWIGLQSRIANSKSGPGRWLLEGSIPFAICYLLFAILNVSLPRL
jgi:hypothetical protein